MVILHELDIYPLGEKIPPAVGFHEKSPLVAENLGFYDENILDIGFYEMECHYLKKVKKVLTISAFELFFRAGFESFS